MKIQENPQLMRIFERTLALLLMFSVYPRKAQKVFIIAILVKKFRKTLVIIRFDEINVQSKDKNQKDSSGTKCLSVR